MTNTLGLIFDMDGVIVHSNPAHKKALHQFCDAYGHQLSDEFIENRLYGRTNEEWIPDVFGPVDDEELKRLADEKEKMFREMFVPEENIVPGLHNFLQDMHHDNIPMAVATSAPRENADFVLTRLEIDSYFDVVLNSSHVTKGKPDPEVYLKAARRLNREPRHCVVFEDSISGVQSGLAAGSKVVGVMTTHSEEELSSCDLVINNFNELELKDLLSF